MRHRLWADGRCLTREDSSVEQFKGSHRHPRTVPAVRAEAFAHVDARAASAHLVIGDRRNATDGQGGALTSRLVPHPLVRA